LFVRHSRVQFSRGSLATRVWTSAEGDGRMMANWPDTTATSHSGAAAAGRAIDLKSLIHNKDLCIKMMTEKTSSFSDSSTKSASIR